MTTTTASNRDMLCNNEHSPPADHVQHIRLACQACQRKKVKCDRTFPCGQCIKSNLNCVQSSRKQRTRHAGRRAVDGELRNRIAKLESLVESLSTESGVPLDAKTTPTDADIPSPHRTNSIEVSTPGVGRYVANTFWSSLTTEVTALREVLEQEDDEDDGTTLEAFDGVGTSPTQPDVFDGIESDLMVCPPGRIYIMPGVMEEPDPKFRRYLIEAFFKNVEPLIKIFHRPSLRAMLDDNTEYLGHAPGSLSHNAIKRLVYFAAVNTLTETEVLSRTGQSKSPVLLKYRRLCGLLLSQSDLLNVSDLATMQCFALFITVCRTVDSSRRTWTSLGLLVRNAQAIYLNQDDLRATPYIRELRRRLWHYIRLLDKSCALDRGTIQLIRSEEFSIPFPISTNDDLFDASSKTIPEIHGPITEMTYGIMIFTACDTIEALIKPEDTPTGPTWEQRRSLAIEMGAEFEEKFLRHCDLSDPFQRMQHAVGKSITTALIVGAVRPMQRHLSSIPPPVDSPEVLQLAVDNLHAALVISKDPDLMPWSWMMCVPWHCLAVALAGLCSIRGTELADEAWVSVEPVFQWCRQDIADGEDGMLWRPIAKLYKKAVAFRDGIPSKSIVASPSTGIGMTSETPVQSTGNPAAWNISWQNGDMDFSNINNNNTTNNNNNNNNNNIINIDHLSNNLSSMAPFTFPTTSAAILDVTTLQPLDLSSGFNDTSWTDWGQALDEFNDPLANNNNISMDILMDEWNFGAVPSGM